MKKLRTIQYEVRKQRLPGQPFSKSKTGQIRIKVDVLTEDGHKRIRNRIRERNPGWEIVGYCERRSR